MINSKFSIITISFNEEKFIENTVKSIINQKYSNIEYIIIDGGSSDRTIEILKKYDEYISYCISEKDNGIYDAMNKGIEKATGDYIIFMNAGDTFFDEEVLRVVNKEIEKSKPDFLYGNAIEIDLENNVSYFKSARSSKYIWYGMFAHHQSMIYKKSIIDNNNLRYNTNYKIAADYDFTFRFLKFSNRIKYIDIILSKFLRGGLSQNNYYKGNFEQWKIKRIEGNFGFLKLLFIFSIKVIMMMIQKLLPLIYHRTVLKKQ